MLIVAESSDVKWTITDHLGSPRMVIGKTGALTNTTRHDYLPFGEELIGIGLRSSTSGYTDEGLRQQFTGYERDDETGLDYAQARYYSNIAGRFTSPDPLLGSGDLADPQSWNRYSYVGNRPLNVTDPSGLIWARRNLGDGRWEYKWFWKDSLSNEDTQQGWETVTEFYYELGNGRAIYLNPNGPMTGRNKMLAIGLMGILGAQNYYGSMDWNGWREGGTREAERLFRMTGTVEPDFGTMLLVAGPMSGGLQALTAGTASRGTVTLFRGVNEANVSYDLAVSGTTQANKLWWQFWKKAATPLEHNTGANGTLSSLYTSWTTDLDVATRFAAGKSGQGVVLEAQIPLSKIVQSPNLKQVFVHGRGVISESEVLVKGTIKGAKVISGGK
jgi:RHS repeat-associated protein